MSSEALAKEDMLPAFVAELLRRSRLGGFRRRYQRDYSCKVLGSTICYFLQPFRFVGGRVARRRRGVGIPGSYPVVFLRREAL